jgi:hypothetical protein
MFLSGGTTTGDLMEHPEILAVLDMTTIVDMAAVKLKMDGAFDDKIKELLAAKLDLEAKQEIATNIFDAEKIKEDAQIMADGVKAMQEAAVAKEIDLSQREALLQARTNQISAQADAVANGEAALSIKQAKFDSDNLVTSTNFANREAELQKSLDDFQAEKDLFEKQKADFNAKLAALKA